MWILLQRPVTIKVAGAVLIVVLAAVTLGGVLISTHNGTRPSDLPLSKVLPMGSSTTTYTIPTYGISFQTPSGLFDMGTSTFSWQSGCDYSDPMSEYPDVYLFSGDSSGGSMDIYVVCEPLASLLAAPANLDSIGEGTTTKASEVLVGTKRAYMFTTIFEAPPPFIQETLGTLSKNITVLLSMGTSTLDIVFSGPVSSSDHAVLASVATSTLRFSPPVSSSDHFFLTYPWFYRKILHTFVFSAPTPLPQPAISPEAALALVEKRPEVQKWLAAFGGKVGGVDPRLGHIASIGITSETASTYTIEIAEITQTLTVADGWYSVDKMTGVVTNDVSY